MLNSGHLNGSAYFHYQLICITACELSLEYVKEINIPCSGEKTSIICTFFDISNY